MCLRPGQPPSTHLGGESKRRRDNPRRSGRSQLEVQQAAAPSRPPMERYSPVDEAKVAPSRAILPRVVNAIPGDIPRRGLGRWEVRIKAPYRGLLHRIWSIARCMRICSFPHVVSWFRFIVGHQLLLLALGRNNSHSYATPAVSLVCSRLTTRWVHNRAAANAHRQQ